MMQSNNEYANENKDFRTLCEKVETTPNKCQASKYRRGKGIVWMYKNKMNIDGCARQKT